MTEGQSGAPPSLWFTCGAQHDADGTAFGNGNFGRISLEAGEPSVVIFKTDGAGASAAAYLHLTWVRPTTDGYPILMLLGSSIFGGRTKDGFARVVFDKNYKKVLKPQWVDDPQAGAMNHRAVSVGNVFFIDGTAASTVTSYQWLPSPYRNLYEPTSDYAGSGALSNYHRGLPSDRALYCMEGCDGNPSK